MREQIAAGQLRFTLDYVDVLSRVAFAFMCVGTPTGDDGDPDMSQVHSATNSLAQATTAGVHLVVVNKSTMPVGLASGCR